MFATGGFGRMFKVTSNAYALTGDGPAIAYRHGVPLEDMEFYQFHPTGIYRLGILLSEAPRRRRRSCSTAASGSWSATRRTSRICAARLVCRAIYQEIRAGRGIGGKDLLSTSTCGTSDPKVIEEKLPDIIDFARIYLGVEPITRADADPADRPLRDGRHPDRHLWPELSRLRAAVGRLGA